MPCLCPQCTSTPAPTYTAEHRAATLARHVLALPKARREVFYAGVAKHRGEAAARKLMRDVQREHRRARETA